MKCPRDATLWVLGGSSASGPHSSLGDLTPAEYAAS